MSENLQSTSVEVMHTQGSGWSVTGRYTNGMEEDFGTYRLRAVAFLIGKGAAKALHTELRVKNRKGQYTDKGASYGNDPRDTRG